MKKLINISKPSKKGYLILFSIFCGLSSFSQEERIVNSLPEILHLSKEKNYALQNATFQTQLANLTKKTAIGNVLNPRIPATAQTLNNFEGLEMFINFFMAFSFLY